MRPSRQFLGPAEAARQLGVSTKALRLYEQRGLLAPVRTEAGWRTYGPVEMERAAEIVALRALGLSLVAVDRVLKGDPQSLEAALTAHQETLESRVQALADTVARVRELRAGLARGEAPRISELARMVQPNAEIKAAFDLPWPWGGERFELRDIRPLNYIIGPLFSGKTRLARAIAEALPDAGFMDMDRTSKDADSLRAQLDDDPALAARVIQATRWLREEGAVKSVALSALIIALESESPAALVVDMVEQDLDQASQEALMSYLRLRGPDARPLFLMTRSCAILDLSLVGPDEAIILCPANHSPPTRVSPYPGAPGYEAVATCLATPEVRARTAGVVALRPTA